MADMRPRIALVRDGLGKMAVYMHECVGQDAIVSRFGPRYQRIFIRGEPCTIFFDKNIRYFIIAPVISKPEFADRPGRYDHIIDLDWIAAPSTAASAGAAGQVKGNGKADDTNPDEPAPTPRLYPKSVEMITGVPDLVALRLFPREVLDKMFEDEPNLIMSGVSGRQWNALSDEEKDSYYQMAEQSNRAAQDPTP